MERREKNSKESIIAVKDAGAGNPSLPAKREMMAYNQGHDHQALKRVKEVASFQNAEDDFLKQQIKYQ